LTNVATSTDVAAMVTELFDVMTVRVGSIVNAGNVTFGVDEKNFEELITVTEVGGRVVRACEGLDKRLVDAISVVMLEDTAN